MDSSSGSDRKQLTGSRGERRGLSSEEEEGGRIRQGKEGRGEEEEK